MSEISQSPEMTVGKLLKGAQVTYRGCCLECNDKILVGEPRPEFALVSLSSAVVSR
jgi:hypothetical protein